METSHRSTSRDALYGAVRDVPDFPKPGIVFRDITPLLGDGRLLRYAVEAMAEPFLGDGVTRVAAIEARGFALGAAVAARLGAGVVLVRKSGKLPRKARRVEYGLEYGTDALELHDDALGAGDRVLVVDDVIATGGTAAATGELVLRSGAALVGYSFLIELADLGGRRQLPEARVSALMRYPKGTEQST